jgi:hypothetical protein
VLAPVVDAIHALDLVLAQAAVLMAARPNASAGIGHKVSERVELCPPARMREPPPAE